MGITRSWHLSFWQNKKVYMPTLTRKQWTLAAIASVVLIVVLGWFFLLRPAAHHYRVVSVSAHTFVLPIMSVALRGSPNDWTLSHHGRTSLSSNSSSITKAQGYIADACGAENGTPAHWIWVKHTHHRQAIIRLAHCEIDLQRVEKSAKSS